MKGDLQILGHQKLMTFQKYCPGALRVALPVQKGFIVGYIIQGGKTEGAFDVMIMLKHQCLLFGRFEI
jgi:hypothetical protein